MFFSGYHVHVTWGSPTSLLCERRSSLLVSDLNLTGGGSRVSPHLFLFPHHFQKFWQVPLPSPPPIQSLFVRQIINRVTGCLCCVQSAPKPSNFICSLRESSQWPVNSACMAPPRPLPVVGLSWGTGIVCLSVGVC